MAREKLEALDRFNRELTEKPGITNLDGNIRQKLDAATFPLDKDKRKTLKGFLAGFTVASLGGVAAQLFVRHPKIIEFDEVTRARWRAQHLAVEDISAIDGAARDHRLLNALYREYTSAGRHAPAAYALALNQHMKGVSPELSLPPLDSLIAGDRESSVKQLLLMRRAKLLAVVGRVMEGLDDIEAAMALSSDEKVRARLLRQAMNHAYIAIGPSDVLAPSSWRRLRLYLEQALEISELRPSGTSSWSAVVNDAVRFDPFTGPGILSFYLSIRAIEEKDDGRTCREILRRHWQVLKILEGADAVTSWNRYTPLAAQAINLGHYDIAGEILADARAIALEKRSGPSTAYASLQRRNLGIEWLFHRVLMARLYLALARIKSPGHDRDTEIHKAKKELLEPLAPEISVRGTLYLRKAKLYWAETLPTDQKRQEARVGANNTMAFTHWTY